MDVAYDHIQEESLSPEEEAERARKQQESGLNSEFHQAFKAVSSSPWGAKLGGFFGQVKKQGESLYNDAQKEVLAASEQATKGFTDLRSQVEQRTRSLSLNAEPAPASEIPGQEAVPVVREPGEASAGASAAQAEAEALDKPESLPADIVKEATSLVASLRTTAAAKLKDIEKAEDAADEALLKFGTNVRNFLRDAVTISAPTSADLSKPKGKDAAGNDVLFETTEGSTGKKVFHTTRFDAQLHAIHTTPSSFTEDPKSEQWETYAEDSDIDEQTGAIAKDLDKYEELRRAMEKLVPEKVEYKAFWTRYYFLRSAVEEEEKRRKEVLRGAAADTEEEVAWDDDDEDEDKSTTPNATAHKASQSVTTLNAPAANELLKPRSPRRSHEEDGKSVADSDASYDIISGATSRAPGSPKEEKKAEAVKEESDEEDWE